MAHDAPDGVSVYDTRVAASNPALEISRQHAEAAKAADNDGSGLSPQDGQQTPGSAKSTRHRNKPSLSCHTCTSKKTKVRVTFIGSLSFFTASSGQASESFLPTQLGVR